MIAVPFELVIQRFGADAEDLGGTRFVAGSEIDRSADHFLFYVFERTAERNFYEAAVDAAPCSKVVRQIRLSDRPTLTDYERAFDYIS